MSFALTTSLSPPQLDAVLDLYGSLEHVSIEQFPGFGAYIESGRTVLYFLAYSGEELSGYSTVYVKKNIIARVMFGPIVRDAAMYYEICKGLISECRSRAIPVLSILPPYRPGHTSMPLEYDTGIDWHYHDDEIHWHTVRLDLRRPRNELYSSFSKNHQRSITKALKLKLRVEQMRTIAEIDTFAEQYTEMYRSRKLDVSQEYTHRLFRHLFDFFERYDTGVFLAIRTEDGTTIGGLCITFQGHSAFYYKGYSHPAYRHIPVSHYGFYEAITIAQARGLGYLDLGGYADEAQKGQQLYNINRFKDGFGGEQIIHERTMLVFNFPLVKYIYQIYRKFRKNQPDND